MEELEKEINTNTEVDTITSSETKTNQQLEDLPRLEDLLKSEKEVKTASKIQGLETIQEATEIEDKIFTRKVDEKKVYLKKRVKILTAVYLTVTTLLLALTGISVATLIDMNNNYTNNTVIISQNADQIQEAEKAYPNLTPAGQDINVDLNEPRDYSDDTKELTFFDKITILFRNIFG